MKNLIEIEGKLNAVQKLALLGFLMGGDNYNEKVINVSNTIYYHKLTNRYHVTVNLEEDNNHKSTSGIGLYIEGNNLMIYSSAKVITVGLTNDIQNILNNAIIE